MCVGGGGREGENVCRRRRERGREHVCRRRRRRERTCV